MCYYLFYNFLSLLHILFMAFVRFPTTIIEIFLANYTLAQTLYYVISYSLLCDAYVTIDGAVYSVGMGECGVGWAVFYPFRRQYLVFLISLSFFLYFLPLLAFVMMPEHLFLCHLLRLAILLHRICLHSIVQRQQILNTEYSHSTQSVKDNGNNNIGVAVCVVLMHCLWFCWLCCWMLQWTINKRQEDIVWS